MGIVTKKIPQSLITESFVKNISALLSSYLWIGDTDKMKLYMNILKEILEVNEKLWHVIPPKDLERIKIIGKAFKENIIPNPWNCKIENILQETKTKDEKSFANIFFEKEEDLDEEKIKEKNIQKLIYSTQESISFLTGENGKVRVICEANSKYGRADIRVEGKKICHIIELKLNDADHKIVGQIMKYARAAGSKLHYGLYEDINMITVAKDYTESTLLDLKIIGVKTYKYAILEDYISFLLI